MSCRAWFAAALFCAIFQVSAETTVPPVYSGNPYANPNNIPNVVSPYVHFKSPNPDMHFTVGQPVRVLADGLDPNAWTVDQIGTPIIELFVDGVSKGTTSQIGPDLRDWNEFVVTGLTAGTHTLELKGTYVGGGSNRGHAIQIIVDAATPHANTVTLTQDLVLSGTENLVWNDATIVGNGFRVRSAATWKGSLTIQNCHVSGLGGLASTGIDITTQNGSVQIEDSVFEWTGAINLNLSGTGSLNIKRNEFRANCQIDLRPVHDPNRAPIVRVVGNPSGTKIFQGNNVAYGFVAFENTNDVLIGGSTDAESNILIGPRCGINLYRCRNVTVRGNYSTHNYHGEWSQGFNFIFGESTGLLVEHNVIRGGSWLVQSLTGEFRYNLIVDSGHDWVRSIGDNSQLHHNIFIHSQGGGGVNEGMWMYSGGSNVSVFNNTIDCGGTLMDWEAPAINISQGSAMASVRNNVVTNIFPSYRPTTAITFVQSVAGAIGYADYNAFWNPNTANGTRYSADAVTGKTVGQAGFGAHDVQADVKFAQGIALPYPVKEGDVWNRIIGLSQVLASFRSRYTPAQGSPLIDSGDPADGPGIDIGAVGAGVSHPGDQFGTFGQVNGNFAPSCRLTTPATGALFATGSTITLTADAIDFDGSIAKVEFFNGSTKLGESAQAPYSFSWTNAPEGSFALTCRATDNRNASTTSQAVRIIVGNRPPTLKSGASAIPNPVDLGQAIVLSAAADDLDGNVLLYTWALGDGTSASGATVSHTYAAIGAYLAQVTVDDSKGGVIVSDILVEVRAAPIGGVPSDPPQSIPPFGVLKLKAKMDFNRTQRDAVAISGVLPNLPARLDPANRTLLLNVNGAMTTFVLGPTGRGKIANATFSLNLKRRLNSTTRKKEFPGGDAAFKASAKNGTWADDWLGTSASVPEKIIGQDLPLLIRLKLNDSEYAANVLAKFTFQKSKNGQLTFQKLK